MQPGVKKILFAGISILGLSVTLILFLFDPARTPIFPICPFHQWTHLDCPGCGGLRAMHALLHGQIIQAFYFNAMLVLSLPFVAAFAVWFALSRFKKAPPITIQPIWLWCYLGVWIAFGVLRNLPIQPFTAFAP